MVDREEIKTQLRVFKHPRHDEKITIKIPKGLTGWQREEAIKDEMLNAVIEKMHFEFVYI